MQSAGSIALSTASFAILPVLPGQAGMSPAKISIGFFIDVPHVSKIRLARRQLQDISIC
jgi:hypothetical protein